MDVGNSRAIQSIPIKRRYCNIIGLRSLFIASIAICDPIVSVTISIAKSIYHIPLDMMVFILLSFWTMSFAINF